MTAVSVDVVPDYRYTEMNQVRYYYVKANLQVPFYLIFLVKTVFRHNQ